MARTKFRFRAQRKFAQGAFVPTQSIPSSSAPPPATQHVSHRPVSRPTAPIILNRCSPQELVTHMSLGRLHIHGSLPIVRLEQNDFRKYTEKEKRKQKKKEKRNLRINVNRRQYMLRNGGNGKNASDSADARRLSVSDSGEDNTPLSRVVTPPVTSSPSNETAASSVVTAKHDTSVYATRSSARVNEKTNGEMDHLSSSSVPVTLSLENHSSERDSSMPKLNTGPLRDPAARREVLTPNVIVIFPERSSGESHAPPVSAHERSSLNSHTGSWTAAHEQLARIKPSVRSLRLRRTTKPYLDGMYLYGSLSDVSSSACSYIPSDLSKDPDFIMPSDESDSCTRAERLQTLKRKPLNKERGRKKIRKTKKTQGASQPLAEDNNLTAPSINDNISENRALRTPNISSSSGINMTEVNIRKIPIAPNIMTTASWILDQSEIMTSRASSTVPENITSNTPGNPGLAIPGSDSLIAAENRSVTPTNSEQSIMDDCEHFKMPKLPARFAKRTKNCPTRSCCDLQELLKIQPTEKDPFCNICKRCELIEKYNEVASKLPVSDVDEPNILQQPPCDLYEFDCDEGGIKYLRRGRELVRNVLTTNKLPIWLSNLDMNLQKSMFIKEHKLGTLKRNIIFLPNDLDDEIMSKIITRVDYLARCIAEDKKELDEETNQRLRASKCTRSNAVSWKPRKNKPLATLVRKNPKGGRVNRRSRKSAHVTALSRSEPSTSRALAAPAGQADIVKKGRVTAPATTPKRVRKMPQRKLYTEKLKNALQKSASVSQPLLADGDTELLARSPGFEQASTSQISSEPEQNIDTANNIRDILSSLDESAADQSLNQQPVEFADHPSVNQEQMELDSNSSFEQLNSELLSEQQLDETNESSPPVDPQEVLVYRPTLTEFQDPIAYIKKIEKEASQYGICKIIPPEGFQIPCHLDENCMFKTVNQYLGRLFQRWGSYCCELTTIQTHVAMLAKPRERDQFTRVPMYDGVELDLVRLFRLVLEHGGIEELLAHNEKWMRIVDEMCLVSSRGKPDIKKLEKIYCKHVLPYESLSSYERKKIRDMVNTIWASRQRAVVRRAQSPLHYQRRLLGHAGSDDEEEEYMDAETQAVSVAAKACFERAEECTAKGRTMNLATFRRIAAQVQQMRFGNKSVTTLTTTEIEADYWQVLSLAREHVCVLSAYIDTSVNKLGHTSDPEGPGGSHPWNLKRISDNPLNILRWLGKTLSVTVPTLSLNQLFSTNCWHRDPHKLAWMDFMHEGTTKIWYGVPASGSSSFRNAVEKLIPSAVQTKGTWLASDTIMIPPGSLNERGVPVRRLVQDPGEFIVVFPGAYACSIATGLTISESIYFEGMNWLNNIDEIFRELRKDCEPAMFSDTLLLLRMAREPSLSEDLLRRVYISIDELLSVEFTCRYEALKLQCRVLLDQSGRADGEQAPISWPNQEECSICRVPLILSKMSRLNEPRTLLCLSHGLRVLNIHGQKKSEPPTVTLLYSNEELKDLIRELEIRVMEKVSPMTKETV